MDKLINRRLYTLRSRNLDAGVWITKLRGFTGIREKFGYRYLATEFHRDTGPPFGTARVIEDTGIDLPDEIGDHDREPVACATCRQPVVWTGPPAPAPWRHTADPEPAGCVAVPQSRQNQALFDWLEVQERDRAVRPT